MKNAFHFILKAPFALKIFKFLSRLFGYVGKTAWLERLTSKFVTSQPGLQTIAIHILPNISQNKGKQAMKFGRLIEYSKIYIFLQKLCRKWGSETSSRPLIFFKKLNIRWKQVVCSLVWIYLESRNLPYNNSKLYKNFDYWSRDMPNFNFSEKGLGLVSPPHFVNDFPRKMFLMLQSINRPKFIAYIWRYWAICVLHMCITSFLKGSQLSKIASDLRVRL